MVTDALSQPGDINAAMNIIYIYRQFTLSIRVFIHEWFGITRGFHISNVPRKVQWMQSKVIKTSASREFQCTLDGSVGALLS